MATDVTPALDALRADLPGTVVLPGDAGWDGARQAWNLAVDQRPAAVALPSTVSELTRVVTTVRDAGLRVAVQTTGHAAGALGSLDRAVLLKTSRLTGVDIDVAGRRARVAAGTVWLDVTRPASAAGLAPLAGSSPDVGVVGYTLGGGLSWLARRHGLAADSVTAVEIVTADGRLRRVDHAQDPDLFWALRGGGGGFGVVTAVEMRLHPVPALHGGWLVWPGERAREVLDAWRRWAAAVPDTVTSTARLLQVPPVGDLPDPLRGRNLVVVEAAMLCDETTAAGLLGDLRALRPELDTFAVMAPVALSRLHVDPEHPTPLLVDEALLGALPAEAVDALVGAAGPGTGSPLLSVELRQLGGALARAAPGAGALATLDGDFELFAGGVALDPASSAAIGARLDALLEALRPWRTRRGFPNFAESDRGRDRTFFPPDTARRLRQVKHRVDPTDLFLANHPVPELDRAG